MKKKLLLVISMVAVLACLFAISISAARVEDYDDTYTLQSGSQIYHYEKWLYNEGKSAVRKTCIDTITVSFFDVAGNPLTEVAMWEYDEAEGRYYSLVWFISDYELFWEDQTHTDGNVGTQTYPKYTHANYTLTPVRALDLRYLTHQYGSVCSSIPSWKESKTLKALEGIYYDVNNTPNDTSDDLKLQDAVGIGRDNDNYGYFGYDAQFAATGNKIVVANFRDCDFQRDVLGNYGTANTWSRADNLQCLWYPDTMLFIEAGIGPVYEVDFGDGMEIIACQILRDNKRIKEVKIPNSVLYLNNEAFRGSDLTTLIIGEGLMVHGNDPFLYTGGSDNIYLSKNIITEQFTSSIPKLVASHSANIFFDGNAAEAAALMEKIIAQDGNYNGKITLVDYNTQADRGSLKNVVIFYNYNRCDAFYNGQHVGEEKILVDSEKGYFAEIEFATVCNRCANKTVNSTIPAILESKGYSACTFGEGLSITQGYWVNTTAMEAYKVYAPDFAFGVLATVNNEGEAYAPSLESENVVSKEFAQIVNDYIDVRVTGIPTDKADALIVLCAYIKVGGKTLYLDAGVCGETVIGISYNEANK